MKEFVEKLIGRLEEYKTKAYVTGFTNNPYELGACHGMNSAIEIVNQLAEEYKPQLNDNDLMIVESLPSLYPMKEFEEKTLQRLVECVKNEYNNGWIACSERLPDDFMSMAYLTTVKGHFYPEVKYYCVANHKWYSNERTTKEVNVIAWMPLPVAFRKGE